MVVLLGPGVLNSYVLTKKPSRGASLAAARQFTFSRRRSDGKETAWTRTGVGRDCAPLIGQSPAGCDWDLGNREGASPHLRAWVGLSGWSSDLARFWPRAFRFATRYREVEGAAAAGRRKSNRFCSTTHESSASRAARLQVLAKLCPRPALNLTSTAQCLLLGPHVLSK